MKSSRLTRILTSVSFAALAWLATSETSWPQDTAALPSRGDAIPREDYQSWSLFLICSPEWVLPEGEERLANLFDQFEAFGAAIGPDHLAVWFWSRPPGEAAVYESIDIVRSAAFCSKLKLAPSKGPYIVVTTQYPGEGILTKYPETFPSRLGNHYILSLNGARATDTTRLLGALADQLVTGDLAHLDPKTEAYWRAWQNAYRAVRGTLINLSNKVSVKITTGFFETEIKL